MAEHSLDKTLYQNKHSSLYDYEFQKHLAKAPWKEWLSESGYFEVKTEYLEAIHKWIHSTELNEIKGLDRFKHRDMISGTTQAFDEAYYRYSGKRLRILRGEYAYHKRVNKDSVDNLNIVNNFEFLDDEQGNYRPVEENDWVITSYPFCGNGGIPPHWDTLQDDCLQKQVPILLDCAWFGTCRDINLDVNHSAITEVCFSLTKGIGLGNIRSGIRYSNYDDKLPIRQQNEYNHLPLGAAQIGLWQMQKFGPDYVQNKYHKVYEHICQIKSIQPTNCIHIGVLNKSHPEYEYYLTDRVHSKVGMRNAVKDFYKKNPDPVFCKAPFTSIYYKGGQNSVGFCCAQEETVDLNKEKSDNLREWWNSDYSKNFRQQFIDGKWPYECRICEWQENNDIDSDRSGFDHIAIDHIDNITGNDLNKPIYIDYRPDNLCNLMCTMCSPSNSNLIEKIYKANPEVFGEQQDYSFQQETQDKILKDKMIDSDTALLKVLGGEPTINKKVHQVFDYCIQNDYAKNIDLKMTTNFTNLNNTYQAIENFRSIKIQASCDGTGPTYEYIRKPARWKKIKENILEFSERYKDDKRFRFGMNCVFQPVNAFTVKDWLPELLTLYYDQMKVPMGNMSILAITGPDGMTFESIPPKFREIIIADLQDVQQQFKNHSNELLKKNITSMISYVNDFHSYKPRKLERFKIKTKTFDIAKKTDITTLHPLFTELLNYNEK